MFLECGGTLEDEKGLIYSHNYPLEYPVDEDCEWHITVPSGNRAYLEFLYWEVSCSANFNLQLLF